MGLKSLLCKFTLSAGIILLAMPMWACQAADDTTADLLMAVKQEKWMSKFGKSYENLAEKETRFAIFRNNVAYIKAFNKGGSNKTYKLALNHFADWTNEEFLARRTGYVRNGFGSEVLTSFKRPGKNNPLPRAADWRKKGAVTHVKSQGQCGAYWAFSAVAAVEGLTKLKTGSLTNLSEQELVDCDRIVNSGCHGGSMDLAFEYIRQNGLRCTESRYPFVGVQSYNCNATRLSSHRVTRINGHSSVPVSEYELMKAVGRQPVSVAIDASSLSFQLYSSGVFTGPCGTDLNHGVTAVGYGKVRRMKFWLIKNSWGKKWGEGGYMRMAKDIGSIEGQCGIAMEASYPIA